MSKTITGKQMSRFLLGGLASFMIWAAPAAAQVPDVLGTHNDWVAYSFKEDGNKVCYMASQPTKDEGAYTKRGEIFAFITHRPAENSLDVVSFVAGYPYKNGEDVTITIDSSKKFKLFTNDDRAWARDSKTDKALVAAMKAGSKMIVEGRSSRGTKTKDTYSLSGFTKAYEAIGKACK